MLARRRSSDGSQTFNPIYSDGPAHGKSTGAFSGSVLLNDGITVVLCPAYSPNIGLYDSLNNTYVDGPAHGYPSTTVAYTSCHKLNDGRILFVPYNGNQAIDIYDPITKSLTKYANLGLLNGVMGSGVLVNNTWVVIPPYRIQIIFVLYDIVNNTVSQVSNATILPLAKLGATWHMSSGCLLNNGKVLFTTDSNNGVICMFDIQAKNFNVYNFPAGLGDYAYMTVSLLKNGNVLFIPFNTTAFRIFNTATNAFSTGPAHAEGTNAFTGSTRLNNNITCITPHSSTVIGFYNETDNTYSKGPAHGRGLRAFQGDGVLIGRKVILPPYNSPNIGILNF